MHWPHATRYAGGVLLSAPFDPQKTPALVADLKRLIPAHDRRYNPATREWFIGRAYAGVGLGLFRRYFPTAEIFDAPGTAEPPPPPGPEPLAGERHFAALHLLPSAPPAVVRAAYHALVKTHHPDTLPEPERDRAHLVMVTINGAYEALRAHGAA